MSIGEENIVTTKLKHYSFPGQFLYSEEYLYNSPINIVKSFPFKSP